MDIEEIEPQGRAPELVGRLAQVWERSVRATHGFLSEDDIAGLRPEVAAGLAACLLYTSCSTSCPSWRRPTWSESRRVPARCSAAST